MTRILGVDPGTTESGVVVWDSETNDVLERYITSNAGIRNRLRRQKRLRGIGVLVVESMTPYAAGYTTMDTVLHIGQLIECARGIGWNLHQITRQAVVKHICGKKAKDDKRGADARVREALLRRFPASGGGKTPQVGIKDKPGPLYGMKTHMWAALAVAITWLETEGGE